MKNVSFKDIFVEAMGAVLNEEDHTYSFNKGQKADFSVTQILNRGTYVSRGMNIAATVGSEIHDQFAKLCLISPYVQLCEWQKSNTKKIALEAYHAVSGYITGNIDFDYVEQPLVGKFNIEGEVVYVGGTPDLVTLSKSDDEEGVFDLHVFDLKTATCNEIQSNWRLQIAVYIAFYFQYLTDKIEFKIGKITGYVIRPGYNYPIPIVTEENINQLLEAFKVKLFAARVKETTLTDSEKQKINIIREQIDCIAFDETRLKSMQRANDEEKQKLFAMLSQIVSDIHKRDPFCTVKDGDLFISPEVKTLTSVDTEFLKVKNPESFCKTSIKTSLNLKINNSKYICEVK